MGAAKSVEQATLGLILSGGGTRGLAHVGVLRALVERGIEPDCLAGTSSGAIVGALHAAGYSPPQMLEFFKEKNPFRVSKLALGKQGLFDTEKVVADFEEYFPDDAFEALDKPLSIVATEIVDGRPVVFDSGPLIAPILASCAVPMIFTPVSIDGNWYLDGGIVDNFPVELVEERCRVRLGVYASPLRRIERADLHHTLVILQRALEVGMFLQSASKFDRCDVVICPEALTRFGAFDTKHFEEVERAGYDAATESMDAIERALTAKS
jgi:NTE family protein